MQFGMKTRIIKIKKKLGRPRTRAGKTKITSVRIEDHVKEVLAKEFGTLANSLYYLYEGLQDFRAQKQLPVVRANYEGMDQIDGTELLVLIEAMKHYIETSPQTDGRRLRPLKTLLMKLLGRHPDGSLVNTNWERQT